MPAEQQAAVMDERGLVLLRRKLEALNYTEHLDAASAPLVGHLVADLIRTTDSYRSIKLQAGQYAQEVATFHTKVRRAGRSAHDTPLCSLAVLVAVPLCSLAASPTHLLRATHRTTPLNPAAGRGQGRLRAAGR
jgi:hypothetical protein